LAVRKKNEGIFSIWFHTKFTGAIEDTLIRGIKYGKMSILRL